MQLQLYKHFREIKFFIAALKIMGTCLLCGLLVALYHEYASEEMESRNLVVEANKMLGNEGGDSIKMSDSTYRITVRTRTKIQTHILGEFLIVCMGICIVGLILLGLIIDLRYERQQRNQQGEIEASNYTEMVTHL